MAHHGTHLSSLAAEEECVLADIIECMKRLGIAAAIVLGFLLVLLCALSFQEPIKDSEGKMTGYSKDEWGVFWHGEWIPGADPKTFHFIGYVPKPASEGDEYAADRTHVFWFDRLVVGADPKTFTLYPQVWQCIKYYGCEARDSRSYYFQDMGLNGSY